MSRVPPPKLKNPPPAYCPSPVATGGDRLDDLIAEIDILKDELGLGRWCNLSPWCPHPDPGSCDQLALENLLMLLCTVWTDQGHGDLWWWD